MTGLGRTEPGLTKHTLAAATGIRPLALCQFTPAMMGLFIRYILTVPATILHLGNLCPEVKKGVGRRRMGGEEIGWKEMGWGGGDKRGGDTCRKWRR